MEKNGLDIKQNRKVWNKMKLIFPYVYEILN